VQATIQAGKGAFAIPSMSGIGLHASAGFDRHGFAVEHGLVEQDFSPDEVHIRGDHRTEGTLHHIV
jgi:hypothetical protein